jgi:hypothetical protein
MPSEITSPPLITPSKRESFANALANSRDDSKSNILHTESAPVLLSSSGGSPRGKPTDQSKRSLSVSHKSHHKEKDKEKEKEKEKEPVRKDSKESKEHEKDSILNRARSGSFSKRRERRERERSDSLSPVNGPSPTKDQPQQQQPQQQSPESDSPEKLRDRSGSLSKRREKRELGKDQLQQQQQQLLSSSSDSTLEKANEHTTNDQIEKRDSKSDFLAKRDRARSGSLSSPKGAHSTVKANEHASNDQIEKRDSKSDFLSKRDRARSGSLSSPKGTHGAVKAIDSGSNLLEEECGRGRRISRSHSPNARREQQEELAGKLHEESLRQQQQHSQQLLVVPPLHMHHVPPQNPTNSNSATSNSSGSASVSPKASDPALTMGFAEDAIGDRERSNSRDGKLFENKTSSRFSLDFQSLQPVRGSSKKLRKPTTASAFTPTIIVSETGGSVPLGSANDGSRSSSPPLTPNSADTPRLQDRQAMMRTESITLAPTSPPRTSSTSASGQSDPPTGS